MLSKSRKRSFIIGIIIVLPLMTWTIWRDVDIFDDSIGNLATRVVIWLFASAMLGAVFSHYLYMFPDDSHFGYRGAVRWAVFGGLAVFWNQVESWFFPAPRFTLLSTGFVALVIYLSYWLLFEFSFRQSKQ